MLYTVDHYVTVVDTVYDHLIKIGDNELEIVNGNESDETEEKHRCVLDVVLIDMLTEYQWGHLPNYIKLLIFVLYHTMQDNTIAFLLLTTKIVCKIIFFNCQ